MHLHSLGRDNVNIMFPSARCDAWISGHVEEQRGGRLTGAEVTLTAIAAVVVFLVVPLTPVPPRLRDESIGCDAARGCDGNLRRFQQAALVAAGRQG